MTGPQIKYRSLKEDIRHNRVAEAETHRTNVTNEQLKSEANAITRYGIDTQAQTSRYATNVQAQTSRFATNMQAQTSRFATVTNAATSKYATDIKAKTSVYDTNMRTWIAQQQQQLNQQYFKLQQLNDSVNRRHTEADIQRLRAQAQQTYAEIVNMGKEYVLKARQQDNNDLKTKADVVQGYINSITGGLRNLGQAASSISQVVKTITSITAPASQVIAAITG